MDFNAMLNRAIRAARLDIAFYNEIEHDTSLNQEALTIVIIVSILSGIGSFLTPFFSGGGFVAAIIGLIVGVVMGVLGYYIWAYVTWWVGTNVFKGTAEVGELLRTLGYASAPRALALFGFIPCVGWIVAFAAGIWALVAGVIAVREALDFDTGNAIITVVIGWVIVFIATVAISAVLGVGAIGLGALSGALQ